MDILPTGSNTKRVFCEDLNRPKTPVLGSSTYSEVTVVSSLIVIEKAQGARELAGEEGHKGHIDT